MLSSTITRTTAKAIFDSMYAHSPQGSVLPPSSVISPETVAQTQISFLGQSLFPTDEWNASIRASHAEVTSPVSSRRAPRRGDSSCRSVSPELPLVNSPSVVIPPLGLLPEELAYSPSSFEGGACTPPISHEVGG